MWVGAFHVLVTQHNREANLPQSKNRALMNRVVACQLRNYYYVLLLQITQADLQAFLAAMGSVETLAANGIRLGGEKYMYISGTDSVCRGKKGTGGVHLAKSKTGGQQ